jgi:hypothetical protein
LVIAYCNPHSIECQIKELGKMVIPRKKRDYKRDKLATINVRVTIQQKEYLINSGGVSKTIRRLIQKELEK